MTSPLYEIGRYWVEKAAHGLAVYRSDSTASKRVATIDLGNDTINLQRAKQEIERRMALD